MYLSQLILNPRSREVRQDLADCHEMHRTIMSGFPDVSADGPGARDRLGVLYRVETDPRSRVVRVLVQSRVRPDWSRLAPGYLADSGGAIENPACKEISEAYGQIRSGMVFRFRLLANPTRRVSPRSELDPPELRGKRVALRTEEEWLAWLARKGEQCGFALLAVRAAPDVPDVRTSGDTKVLGRREGTGRGGARLTFGSVLFDGHLRVTDAERFRQALVEGVGPAKAYGFGLLSIAPARAR